MWLDYKVWSRRMMEQYPAPYWLLTFGLGSAVAMILGFTLPAAVFVAAVLVGINAYRFRPGSPSLARLVERQEQKLRARGD